MDDESASSEAYPLEALASLPEFYHPTVSPAGDAIACYYDGSGRNELWLVDAASGERRQVSDGEVPKSARWHLQWDRDGERVFFHRDTGGDEQNDVHALRVDGSHETVVEVDGQAIISEPSPGDRSLLYASDAGEQMNLYRYDTETGETNRVTDYDQPVWLGQYDPAGERIAYIANETDDLDNIDAYVANADGSDPRRLALGDAGSECDVADWGLGGAHLLVGDNASDTPRAGVYALDDDRVEWLGDGTEVESPAAFTPDGERALVIRTREAATVPVVYDLTTGDDRELDLPDGVVSVAGGVEGPFLADGRVVLTQETPATRKRLLAYDLATDDYEVLLDAEYGDIDAAQFVDAEYVTYDSDEWEIGALLYDARERPGTDADATDQPAVVYPHGGPHAQSTQSFDEYAQFFVSRGYSVLKPNYRGSTGRTRSFKYAIRGDWGGGEQRDIARGAEWLADRAWIDEDRIAVFGGSYGGYSAYSQHVQRPGLFAACLAWVGITDLDLLYEESMAHYQYILEKFLGDPEENAALYRDRSPVTHVENAEDPLLIAHGVNDPRCPISQARTYRDALEARGWTEGEEFAYEELGDEGHGSTDTEQKLRAYRLVADYLDAEL